MPVSVHRWLRTVHIAYLPGPATPLLEEVAEGVLRQFRFHGHQVQERPDDQTDVILTTARFGEVVPWRQALLFSVRRRFGLKRAPLVYTMLQVSPGRLQELLDHFEAALAKERPDPADFAFPGLAPQAHRVLFKQGRRGGPILALERLVQAQAKSIRILLVVGEEEPLFAYHFDLVGSYPRSEAADREAFYRDIALRMVTILSTEEVTDHEVAGDPIPRGVWASLETPKAMQRASRELGSRNFFTEMVRIADLVHVPAVSDAIASQYSEGCFATWDPHLGALIATATGSARPVDKGSITEEDLAVVVGVRPDGQGALIQQVEGRPEILPSSEAVEMMEMDRPLPAITLGQEWGIQAQVPVVRSKLHGHRGVAAYDPRLVEFAPLDPPYYHYPVSCATEAQAWAVRDAFSRSKALRNPEDPRLVVFTVLPGHGVVIVEKWVAGKAPFQVIWEYMDAGYMEIASRIPQGEARYVPGPDGRMRLSGR